MRVQAAPPVDARPIVDRLIAEAIERRASDIHVEPASAEHVIRYRIDGLLESADTLSPDAGRAIVARLMVMARLLTYRLDVPQEGRFAFAGDSSSACELDCRLSIMPTTHGLRATVRLPAELVQPRSLADLALPPAVVDGLSRFANSDSGMLIVTGPAGSGKTTTLYALLGQIALDSPGVSIVALEDPVERDLPGVTQIEVSPFGQLTYERALRSILRQDPQVLMLGEIRDASTATLAMQAALSGHRLICTFHASSAGGAISRLVEMGIEPYQVTSALYGVVSQRLLRRRREDGGYRGRVPIAEFARLDTASRAAILRRDDADAIQRAVSAAPDHLSLRGAAQQLIAQGVTDAAEAVRVLGGDFS